MKSSGRIYTYFMCGGLLLLGSCFCAWTDAGAPIAQTNLHLHAHAHNDYEHARPLFDALENRFYSVEADIWLVGAEILVSHNAGNYKGNLKELYLDPLQRLVNEKGSVHGDGETFYLWLDFKESGSDFVTALHELLSGYSMLTVFTGERISEGAVTVILTGTAEAKESYAERFSERYATRDSNFYSATDPPAGNRWLWYALPWSRYLNWNGPGDMPSDVRSALVEIVDDIHAKDRKVRFYAVPQNEAYWQAALETGVDLINTDDLDGLNRFLERYAEEQSAVHESGRYF